MNLSALFALIKKNLKLLLRSKMSAVIVLFGPLLLMILLAVAFQSATIYGVRIGVYSEEYSPLSTSLIEGLQKQQMTITYVSSQEECLHGLRLGLYNVCAVFPPRYSVETGSDIVFHVDPSRYNLVPLLVEELSKQIAERSTALTEQLTQGIVDSLDEASQTIEDRQGLLAQLSRDIHSVDELIDTANSQLATISLNASADAYPFDYLQAQVDDLEEQAGGANSSSAGEIVHSIRVDVEALIQQMHTIDTVRWTAYRHLGDAKSIIEGDIGTITYLQDAFQNVLGDLNDVKSKNVGIIAKPLRTRIEPVLGASESTTVTINYLFPTLLAILLMFSGLLLAATLEVREKTDKVHFKNFLTPTNQLSFTLGNFLANVLVLFAQSFFLFIAGLFFFSQTLVGVWFDLLIAVALISATFVLLGMFLGTLFRHEETTLIVGIAVGFILLFFSGAILPVEVLPNMFSLMYQYNPFALGEFLLNKIVLFQTGITVGELGLRAFLLLGWIVLLFVLNVASRSLVMRRSP